MGGTLWVSANPKRGTEFGAQLDFEITTKRWQYRAEICVERHFEVLLWLLISTTFGHLTLCWAPKFGGRT